MCIVISACVCFMEDAGEGDSGLKFICISGLSISVWLKHPVCFLRNRKIPDSGFQYSKGEEVHLTQMTLALCQYVPSLYCLCHVVCLRHTDSPLRTVLAREQCIVYLPFFKKILIPNV